VIFIETPLAGAYLIELEPHHDARGFFARTFCRREFEARGLNPEVAQCNTSFNHKSGTLRGLHFQRGPCQESKVVRCIRGGIFDVIVDLRNDSTTYGRHFGVELTAENRRALYVPPSFAHGFQTLADETEVDYQMGDFYDADGAVGYRFDDPAFAISWPLPVTVISETDRCWPAFT
jgi:dTDP-4-dehydrorhamnose 3,5-epimerase